LFGGQGKSAHAGDRKKGFEVGGRDLHFENRISFGAGPLQIC
jgi:hypothetical protein